MLRSGFLRSGPAFGVIFQYSRIRINFNCSEYDHQSIMHYGGSRKVCKKFNDPYMTLKPSRQEIPVNKELSVLDIQALKEFYAPPSKSPTKW